MAVIVDQLMQIYQGYEFSYFENARVLADLAKKKEVEIDDKVIAVLLASFI